MAYGTSSVSVNWIGCQSFCDRHPDWSPTFHHVDGVSLPFCSGWYHLAAFILFSLRMEFIGVTLVNTSRQVSGAQSCNTSSAHWIVWAPPQVRCPSPLVPRRLPRALAPSEPGPKEACFPTAPHAAASPGRFPASLSETWTRGHRSLCGLFLPPVRTRGWWGQGRVSRVRALSGRSLCRSRGC